MTRLSVLRDRREVLREMMEELDGRCHGFRECDDCHRDRAVVTDPDTADAGDFEYCLACVEVRLHRIAKAIRKEERHAARRL